MIIAAFDVETVVLHDAFRSDLNQNFRYHVALKSRKRARANTMSACTRNSDCQMNARSDAKGFPGMVRLEIRVPCVSKWKSPV